MIPHSLKKKSLVDSKHQRLADDLVECLNLITVFHWIRFRRGTLAITSNLFCCGRSKTKVVATKVSGITFGDIITDLRLISARNTVVWPTGSVNVKDQCYHSNTFNTFVAKFTENWWRHYFLLKLMRWEEQCKRILELTANPIGSTCNPHPQLPHNETLNNYEVSCEFCKLLYACAHPTEITSSNNSGTMRPLKFC